MKKSIQSDQDIVLKLNGVTKRIGKHTLVDRLSFSIRKGEIVGLLGPNGAGKTTTIRMIVGLIGMTAGDIVIRGNSVKHQFAQAISQVGAIVENPEFYPYMSGLDNLKQYQRMTADVTDERLNQVIELVGLKDAMDKRVKAYSLGMRQRLGIAQALLHKPSLLILDEPTNGLDPAGIREMRNYLKKIAHTEQIAILVSSHLLSEMEQMCSRVVVIQQGKLVTERVINEPAVPDFDRPLKIRMLVDDAAAALSLLQDMPELTMQATCNTTGNELDLSIRHHAIPELVRQLCAKRIAVFRIIEEKQSLEDEFMQWTGGDQIA